MQTHAGQESREYPQKIGADRSSIFELSRKRWKLAPMTHDLINRQIRSKSPRVHFPCIGGQYCWIASLWACSFRIYRAVLSCYNTYRHGRTDGLTYTARHYIPGLAYGGWRRDNKYGIKDVTAKSEWHTLYLRSFCISSRCIIFANFSSSSFTDVGLSEFSRSISSLTIWCAYSASSSTLRQRHTFRLTFYFS